MIGIPLPSVESFFKYGHAAFRLASYICSSIVPPAEALVAQASSGCLCDKYRAYHNLQV